MPKGGEFEEFVSSFLQQPGRYVERQLHEKEQHDVLELDIVLTDYLGNDFKTHIVEVKSGSWGCTDLFKLCGQMRYLKVESGHVVALGNDAGAEPDFMRSVAEKLGIDIQWVPAYSEAGKALEPLMPQGWTGEPGVSELWRYSYWLDRCLARRLNDLARSTSRRGPQEARAIQADLQTNLFSRDLLCRTTGLYDTYKKARHLSARWTHEEHGSDFDHPPSEQIPPAAFKATYYDEVERPHDLDVAAWLEHRMRMAVLKNAVDSLAGRNAASAPGEPRVTADGRTTPLRNALPRTFQTGVDALVNRRWVHLYPVLWQWFMWLCGGVILLDHESEQYSWLSDRTGMPCDVIPEALSAFDLLFPTQRGWLRSQGPNSRVKVMALMPVPFLGIGANLCRLLFAEDGEFASLRTSGNFTQRDLLRWNNNLCEYLTRYGLSDSERTTKAGRPGRSTETSTAGVGAHIGFTVEPQ
jgi:hypothetical protein